LGDSYLIALSLSRAGKAREAVQKHPDVERAQKLVLETLKKFPENASEWHWAMLRATHPQESAKVAQLIQKDEFNRLERDFALHYSPFSGSSALNAYWAAHIAGKEKEGLEILKLTAARGVPLPPISE